MTTARVYLLPPVLGLGLLAAALGARSAGYPSPNYGISDSVVVGHVVGRLFTLDVVNRRLYGAGNAIVDVDRLRIIGHIADSTPGATYMVVAETDRGITNTGLVFSLADGAVGQHLPVHAKGFAYDPITRRAFLLGDTVTVFGLATGGYSENTARQPGMGGGGGEGEGEEEAVAGMEAATGVVCPRPWSLAGATRGGCTGLRRSG